MRDVSGEHTPKKFTRLLALGVWCSRQSAGPVGLFMAGRPRHLYGVDPCVTESQTGSYSPRWLSWLCGSALAWASWPCSSVEAVTDPKQDPCAPRL
jgi:hypothetical protein